MTLFQISYFSEANPELTTEDVARLVEDAQRINLEVEITGVLMLRKGRFFQVIEGPDRAVDLLMQRIKRDKRHHDIMVVSSREIRTRDFPNWSMGWSDRPPLELAAAEAFDGVTQRLRNKEHIGSSDVLYIVDSFCRGLWDIR